MSRPPPTRTARLPPHSNTKPTLPKPKPTSTPTHPLLKSLLSLPTTLRTHLSTLTPSSLYRLLPRPSTLLTILSLYCTTLLISTHLLTYSYNTGPSMLPTVPERHSFTIYNLWHRRGRDLRIGDIIQLRNPFMPGQLAGKRVLGMPGDFVVRDGEMSGGVGGVESGLKRERYGLGKGEGEEGGRKEPQMIRVPEGHVWVQGDNLSRSRDSRFYGPVPLALVRAKALVVCEGGFSWRWVGSGQVVRAAEG